MVPAAVQRQRAVRSGTRRRRRSRPGEVAGTEALLRWNHPERGLVMPGRFMPQVESSPLIDDVTWWVVDAADARPRDLDASAAARSRSSINVSVRNLHNRAPAAGLGRGPRATRRRPGERRPGDHRERRDGRLRPLRGADRPSARSRVQRLDRRLRHRPLIARLPQAAAGHEAQDRPGVHPPPRDRSPAISRSPAASSTSQQHSTSRASPKASRTKPRPTCSATGDATTPKATSSTPRAPSTSSSPGSKVSPSSSPADHLGRTATSSYRPAASHVRPGVTRGPRSP